MTQNIEKLTNVALGAPREHEATGRQVSFHPRHRLGSQPGSLLASLLYCSKDFSKDYLKKLSQLAFRFYPSILSFHPLVHLIQKHKIVQYGSAPQQRSPFASSIPLLIDVFFPGY